MAMEDKHPLEDVWRELAVAQMHKLLDEGVSVQEAQGLIRLYIKGMVGGI